MKDNEAESTRQCPRCGAVAVITIRSKLPDSDLELQVHQCCACHTEIATTVDAHGNIVLKLDVK